MVRFLFALGVLAGCAAPPALRPMADASASGSPAVISLRPLGAVQQPDLPPALRNVGVPDVDANSMATPADTPLGDALAAYLAIHTALASDTIDGVADAAHAFQSAFELAIQDAPADDPHLWHMRSAETVAVQTHASSLAEASDLARARIVFGELSAPFAALIEAVGAPAGFDLVRHTCGMQSEAPEGGVWLQQAGDVQNPYFGGGMQMCVREQAPMPNRIEMEASAHMGMDHGDR